MRAEPQKGARTGSAHLGEAELEAALDAIPARITVWDQDLRLAFVNAVSGNYASTTRRGMLGTHLSSILGAEQFERDRVAFASLLRGEATSMVLRYTGVARDDRARETHFSSVVLDGVVEGVTALSVNIGERLTVQHEAAELRKQVALAQERHRVAAEVGASVLGSLEEALAELNLAVGDPVASAGLRESATRRVHTVGDRMGEVLRSLQGHPPEPGPGPVFGREVYAVAAEAVRHTTHETSGLSRDLLESILDSVPAGVSVWTPALVNLYVNDAARRQHGLGPGEPTTGRHLSSLVTAGFMDQNRAFIDQALAGQRQHLLRTGVGAEGTTHQEVHYEPMEVGGQQLLVALVLDATADVDARAEALESQAQAALALDRERILHDLQDRVLQHLFAAELRFAGPRGADPEQVRLAVAEVEVAMSELRRSLERLNEPASSG